MMQCDDIFDQKGSYDDYYAEIDFYLKRGQFCYSITYTGFNGSLEEGIVRLSRGGDYLLEGEAVGYALYMKDNIQKMQMQFSPAKCHIWWGTPDENGEYYSDYYLTKGEAA